MSITRLLPSGVPGPSLDITIVPVIPTPPDLPSLLEPTLGVAGPWTRLRTDTDNDAVDSFGRHIFSLEYNGTLIELPSPTLGDTQDLEVIVLNRRSRGGRARVFRDQSWFSLHRYNYTFKKVELTVKDAFLTLAADAMGDRIEVIDHLNQVFTDMFIVEVGQVVEEHNDLCSYTIDVVMQVVR